MTQMANLLEFSESIEQLLIAHKDDLDLQEIYFGDQDRIASTPAACIEPMTKDNNISPNAASRILTPILEVVVIVYHSAVQSTQQNVREVIAMAQNIEDLINNQINFGGTVISSYVARLESGFITKAGTPMRATRLSVIAKTRRTLPS